MSRENRQSWGRKVKYDHIVRISEYQWTFGFMLCSGKGKRLRRPSSLADRWLAEVREMEGRRIGWYRLVDTDPTDGKPCIYGSFAGVRPSTTNEAEARWAEMSGNGQVFWADPGILWFRYSLEMIAESPYYDYAEKLWDRHLCTSAPINLEWTPPVYRGAFDHLLRKSK